MSNPALQRLLLLSASGGITTSEFKSIIRSINDFDEEDLLYIYAHVRRKIRNFDLLVDEPKAVRVGGGYDEKISARQAVLNLALQANLSSYQAASILHNQLHNTLNDERISMLPSYDKKVGIRRWLDKLIDSLGPNVVINNAVAAFMKTDKKSDNSWKLSK